MITRIRLAIGALGVLVLAYGVLRLVQQQHAVLPGLARWLIGAVLVHDLLIAPSVIGIGWLVNRYVRTGARPYVVAGLVAAGMVASVAVFDIRRQHKYSASSLTLLRQNYVLNAAILFGLIAAVTVGTYLLTRRPHTPRGTRPPA